MKKTTLFCLLSFVFCLLSNGQTLTQKFYFDFGRTDRGTPTYGVDTNGNYWNNIIAPNADNQSTLVKGYTVNVINSDSTTTAIVLETTADVQSNGGASCNMTNPQASLLGDLAIESATNDYIFIDNQRGAFVLKNLDVTKTYKFFMFGSREATDQRIGTLSISGTNGSHTVYQTSGAGIGTNIVNTNDNHIWETDYILPKSDGTILVEMGNLTGMFYLNCMKIEEYSGVSISAAERKIYIDFGKNNNGLDGAPTVSPDVNGNYWNNMYSNGDGPTTGVSDGTNNLNLVFSDNAASSFQLELTSIVQFNGVRNGALGGNDTPNEPTVAKLGDLAIKTATYDYLFLDNQTAILKFKNLNPAKKYRFSVFGSRKDDSAAGRVGKIEITGTNSIKGIHQMGGAGIGANNSNDRNIFVSDPMIPTYEGLITFTMTCWKGFSHINVMKVEELAGEEVGKVTAIAVNGNSITQCGRTSQMSIAVTPEGAICPSAVWSVDNENIARITAEGKLYAKENGTLTVTATVTMEDIVLTASKEITVSGQNIPQYSLAIMGSSVPSGTGASAGNGYAQLYEKYLEQTDTFHTWTVTNISIGGNTTTDVKNRWDNDFLPTCSRYIYYGLSLGNEGIHERGQAAYDSWRDGMLNLIDRARSHGKIPFVGNNYPRGDFNATDYNYVKQLNLLIHEWDVPSVNLLGSIDNGAGQWAAGYINDNAHPNTVGHAEMYYVFVPSLIDAMAADKPQPVRTETSGAHLQKTNIAQRIALKPEGTLHSFTLTFSFQTTNTGTVATWYTAASDTLNLKIGADGKLYYRSKNKRYTLKTAAAVNNGQWHTVSLTNYYAWQRTKLYVDGAEVTGNVITERFVPTLFYINAFEDAPAEITYRDLFFHRAGMNANEMTALHTQNKMLKSSLEIYAPLATSGTAVFPPEYDVTNFAQSFNTLLVETQTISAIEEHFSDILCKDVYLYSLTGQIVSHFKNAENLSLSDFPKGIYIKKSTDGKRVKSEKIVVK